MKNKELFLKALSTLCYSWGSDTPVEVVWAFNELLDWYEQEYNVTCPYRLLENDNAETKEQSSYYKIIEWYNNN